jgi:tetratricopeptide (TPR) repeat protein
MERFLVGFHSIVHYLVNMLLPLNLLPFYAYPPDVLLWSVKYLIPIVLFAGITVCCSVMARKQPVWMAVWLYYVITLLPVIGIVQVGNQSMADRYTYLPSLGPFLIAGMGAAWIWARADSSKQWRVAGKASLAAAACLLLSALSFGTVKQIALWKDNRVFWNYLVEKSPYPIPIAYNNRGLAFQESGQADRAIADFTTAITLDPAHYAAYLAYVNRGIVFKDRGETYKALEDFNMALILNPSYANAYYNRGWIFAETGQLDRAVEDYTRAIEIDPANGKAFNNRGAAHEDLRQFDRALADYEQAIRLDPFDYLAYGNRGMVLGRMGRPGEAVESFTRAIEINPDFIRAYRARGELYAAMGLPDRSEQDRARAAALEASAVRAGAGQERSRAGGR